MVVVGVVLVILTMQVIGLLVESIFNLVQYANRGGVETWNSIIYNNPIRYELRPIFLTLGITGLVSAVLCILFVINFIVLSVKRNKIFKISNLVLGILVVVSSIVSIVVPALLLRSSIGGAYRLEYFTLTHYFHLLGSLILISVFVVALVVISCKLLCKKSKNLQEN